jgi:hypothetical protein
MKPPKTLPGPLLNAAAVDYNHSKNHAANLPILVSDLPPEGDGCLDCHGLPHRGNRGRTRQARRPPANGTLSRGGSRIRGRTEDLDLSCGHPWQARPAGLHPNSRLDDPDVPLPQDEVGLRSTAAIPADHRGSCSQGHQHHRSGPAHPLRTQHRPDPPNRIGVSRRCSRHRCQLRHPDHPQGLHQRPHPHF